MLSVLLQLGLFVWFILSLYLVAKDNTLSSELRILGEILNVMSLLFILSNMTAENSGVAYFGIGTLLLMWYLYYTPQDIANPGYTIIEKVCYGVIDITFIIYLISSMTLALTVKHLAHYSLPEQINLIKSMAWI